MTLTGYFRILPVSDGREALLIGMTLTAVAGLSF